MCKSLITNKLISYLLISNFKSEIFKLPFFTKKKSISIPINAIIENFGLILILISFIAAVLGLKIFIYAGVSY
jgi:hypothetical protein